MKSVLFASLALLLAACSNSLATESIEIPTTNLNFSIPNETHVSLWIENAYQTKVRTLVDERLPPGSHTIELEMIDDNGNHLPYGLYVYYIQTDDYSHSNIFFYPKNQ